MVDRALKGMTRDFMQHYACELLWVQLPQEFYSSRSEQLLVEELGYHLQNRWFTRLSADAPVWERSAFSKDRQQPRADDLAHKRFTQMLTQAQVSGLTSGEHFSVDGTFIEAWASQLSFSKQGWGRRRQPEWPVAQVRAQLRWRDAQQRLTRVDHGPATADVPHEFRTPGTAVLRQSR